MDFVAKNEVLWRIFEDTNLSCVIGRFSLNLGSNVAELRCYFCGHNLEFVDCLREKFISSRDNIMEEQGCKGYFEGFFKDRFVIVHVQI